MNIILRLTLPMIAVLLSGLSAIAGRTLTINVNDASLVTMSLNYQTVELKNGTNLFTEEELGSAINVSFTAVSGNIFKEITNTAGTVVCSWNTTYRIYDANEGDYVYNIDVVSFAQARTGKFTLNIDNPEKVTVVYGAPTYSILEGLQVGENHLGYIPGVETSITITAQGNGPLYKVTNNGEEITSPNYRYVVNLTEGAVIDVKADFPDVKLPVTFKFLNDCEGFISKVTVDDKEVDDWLSDNFNVNIGSKITVYGNTIDYQFTSLECSNGLSQTYFYGSWNTYVLEPLTITIDATQYYMLNCKVNIDNFEAVTVQKGASNSTGIAVKVHDGINEIQVAARKPVLYFIAKDGYLIDSVTADGTKATLISVGVYEVNITDNMTVNVKTSVMVRDQKIVVYVDNPQPYDVVLRDAKNVTWTLDEGYNLFEKAKEELTAMTLTVSGDRTKREVYFNGQKYEPTSEGGNKFLFYNLTDGDVIKAYPYGIPEKCKVEFNVSVNTGTFTALHDMIVAFDTELPLECFAGTLITIIPSENNELKLTVNGDEIEKDPENGNYSFTVNENSKVELTGSNNTGIDSVNTNMDGEDKIYNLQGIRINSNKENLPAGIYIINGRKTIIR